jgi:hypothetical protein
MFPYFMCDARMLTAESDIRDATRTTCKLIAKKMDPEKVENLAFDEDLLLRIRIIRHPMRIFSARLVTAHLGTMCVADARRLLRRRKYGRSTAIAHSHDSAALRKQAH